jgi:DNA-directed RNA polymerase subunit RPC12/RpoP
MLRNTPGYALPQCPPRKTYCESKYGVKQEDVDLMLEIQNYKCAICSLEFGDTKSTKPNIDHDHITLRVRGLLCQHCNLMLGHAKDNTETLLAGISYLSK